MKSDFINSNFNQLDETIKWILGRPSFCLGGIARRMRELGYNCPQKAEAEQALVIHTMLKYYLNHGENWKEEFEKHLNPTKQ